MEPKNSSVRVEEMKSAVQKVKDEFGVHTAKALIQSFGVPRLVEIPEQLHWTVEDLARKMTLAIADGKTAFNAEKILVDHANATRQQWANQQPSERTAIDALLRDHGADKGGPPQLPHTVRGDDGVKRPDGEPLQLAVGHHLSPNDMIATLLEIALAAQPIVVAGPVGTYDAYSLRIKTLADAFAPLQQLPGPLSLTPAERAKLALTTFVQATSVTVAGKEALEGIMAAMDAAVPGFMQAGGRLDMVPNNGWVIAQQAVVTMPDGKKELGYTLLSGLGVFTDEADASKSLAELQLPLGYVIMTVDQLLPGYIMPLLDDAVGLEKPVNKVYAVRNYDDAYVDQLSVAVADLASDGKRFRTMIWMIEMAMERDDLDPQAVYTPEQEAYFANSDKAERIMEKAQPETLEQFRAALDDVYRAGLLPNMDAKAVDTAKAHDVLRADALKLAEQIAGNYRTHHMNPDNGMWCKHCGFKMPADASDTMSEHHTADCAVVKARQLIENES